MPSYNQVARQNQPCARGENSPRAVLHPLYLYSAGCRGGPGRLQPSGVDDLSDFARSCALNAHTNNLFSEQAGACSEKLPGAVRARENDEHASVVTTDDARGGCRHHLFALTPMGVGSREGQSRSDEASETNPMLESLSPLTYRSFLATTGLESDTHTSKEMQISLSRITFLYNVIRKSIQNI